MSSASANKVDSRLVTIKYKSVDGVDLLLDAYLPFTEHSSAARIPVPAVVFFHGGGLTVASRQTWLPYWLQTRINAAGYIFISADYRLLPPSTAHDILVDIKDLFRYLVTKFNDEPAIRSASVDNSGDRHLAHLLDVNNIAVTGGSAGGLCAYLAAMHASPTPRAVVSFYGAGGNFLIPRYYLPKEPGYDGEYFDFNQFLEYLYPASMELPPTSKDEIFFHPDTPDVPANPRFQLESIWIQQGVYLDYYTGCHEPSLSAAIREAAAASEILDPSLSKGVSPLASAIPPEQKHIFPSLGVTSDWPPTLLIHGDEDTSVSIQQSQHLFELLQDAGVDVTLKSLQGQGHAWDLLPSSEELFGQRGGLFDEVVNFFVKHLGTGK